MTYKAVGYLESYEDVYLGHISANLVTGGGTFLLESQQTGVICKGIAQKPYYFESIYSCKGQRGKLTATCDDGHSLNGEWVAQSCTTGFGSGKTSS